VSHVNSAGRVGALLGLTDPAASSGDLANGGSTVTSTSVPDHVSGMPHNGSNACCCLWPVPWLQTGHSSEHQSRFGWDWQSSGSRQLKLSAPCHVMQVDGMPLTDVLLVNIKLLTLPELKLITDQGADGRRQLSEAFSGPSRLVSSLKRKSVISENTDS
jgi:hypothetical protein